jgi:hypothetical protein
MGKIVDPRGFPLRATTWKKWWAGTGIEPPTPHFPDRIGCYEDAETFCQRFFPWYNVEHRHRALGLMTPHDIHYGLAAAKWQQRAEVLRAAYAAHPERFPHGVPVPPPLSTAAWINKPAVQTIAVQEGVDWGLTHDGDSQISDDGCLIQLDRCMRQVLKSIDVAPTAAPGFRPSVKPGSRGTDRRERITRG